MTKNKTDTSLSPIRITLLYLIVAGLWIIITDNLVNSFISDPQYLSSIQTYKGWFYVAITALGLLYLLRKYTSQLRANELKLESLLDELRSEKELKDVLFERIPILITIYDPELQSFEVNNEFRKVLGWSNEEIKEYDINLLEACFPDHETREEVVEFMENPGIGWKEFAMVTKSGDKIPTSWTNIQLTDNTSVGIGIDMTEIKASQAKIRKSRKLLKKTFESLKESVIVLDAESKTIIKCNKSTEEIFGYSRDELIGNSTKKLHVSEEKYQEFGDISEPVLEEKGIFQTEFEMQKKDGSHFYSDHTVTLLRDEEGKIEKAVSVVRDITEEKKYEQKLERRKERLQRSQEISQIGDWEFNTETEEIFWSPMLYEIFKRDPDLGPPTFEELQTNYFQEQSEKHNRAVQKAVDDGQLYDVDLPLQIDQGNQKYIRTIGSPVKDESGNVIKLWGIVQDITERKKIELALSVSKERIQNITDNVPGVVFRYILENDGSDRLEFVSKGAKGMWGISPNEAQNNINFIWENYHSSDVERVKKSIQRSAETLSKWNAEWRYIMPDGTVRWHHGIGIPNKRENGSVVWNSIMLDITERKELEQRLSKEKQRFQLVAETTSDVIWDLDVQNKELWWSKGFEETFGYTRRDSKTNYESWLDYIHPEDREAVSKSSQKLLENSDQKWQEEYRIIKKDGSVAHIIDRAEIIRDNDGKPIRMVGTMDDITDRKEAEKRLRESEKKYRHLFENNPEPMCIFNPDTLEFVEVNQAAVKHYGYTKEEFSDMKISDVYPPEDIPELRKEVEKARGEEVHGKEWINIKKDGTRINVIASATDVPYRGQMFRMIFVNDITAQKKLRQQLQQSEKKYRHLFENNPEPMWIYNPDTLEFVEVNQAAVEHYGYSEEEFLNMTLADIRPPEDIEAMKQDVQQDQGKDSYSEEWTHLKKDGTKIDVDLSAADVKYKGDTFRLVLVNDVTEEKRVQEKMIQSIVEGENRERKRIAHELHDGLGQYLVAANMNFESVKSNITDLEHKRQNQFKMGLSLLKNALSETRSISYNLMPKAIADFGLVTALENMVQDFRKSTDIAFQFDYNCDDLQLKNQAEINIYRIFQEVTSNSVRHAECSRISLKLQLKEDSLNIIISDNGIGAELNEQQKESGLGLQGIKMRVSNLGGALDIDSKPGEGMKTIIKIPNIQHLATNGGKYD